MIWSFRIFEFPVRVDPWFWVVAIFLGGNLSLPSLIAWIPAVFVSVLVHELGHAGVGHSYGLRPSITLYGMGGVTQWRSQRRLTDAQQILLSLAGPTAGFVLGTAVWLLSLVVPAPASRTLGALVIFLIYVNFFWGLLNLLPVLPLDGGNIMRSIVHAVRGWRDEVLPLQISIAVGAAGVVLCFSWRWWVAALLAGFITYQNYNQLGAIMHRR